MLIIINNPRPPVATSKPTLPPTTTPTTLPVPTTTILPPVTHQTAPTHLPPSLPISPTSPPLKPQSPSSNADIGTPSKLPGYSSLLASLHPKPTPLMLNGGGSGNTRGGKRKREGEDHRDGHKDGVTLSEVSSLDIGEEGVGVEESVKEKELSVAKSMLLMGSSLIDTGDNNGTVRNVITKNNTRKKKQQQQQQPRTPIMVNIPLQPISRPNTVPTPSPDWTYGQKCHHCPALFLNKPSLDAHVHETHLCFYPCNICTASFQRVHHLYHHRQIVHKSGSFLCHVCKQWLDTMEEWEGHMRKVHGGGRLWKCPGCLEGFEGMDELKGHFRERHEVGVRVVVEEETEGDCCGKRKRDKGRKGRKGVKRVKREQVVT